MKLANIYSVDSGGAQRGQAATGATDTDCLDIKANDSGGILRDIKQIVTTDSAGVQTNISKRLVTTTVPDYKYMTDNWATSPYSTQFCNAALLSGTYYLYCQYRGTILIDSTTPFPSYEEWICLSWNSAAVHWGIGITPDRWLYYESAHGGYKNIGYAVQIPFDTKVYIDIRSGTSLGETNNLIYYKINNATEWGYFSDNKGSGSAVSFQKFTEYSTYLQFGRAAPLWLTGSQMAVGCQNGNMFPESSFNIENLPAGTGNFSDGQGRTYTGAKILQHNTTTKTWEF